MLEKASFSQALWELFMMQPQGFANMILWGTLCFLQHPALLLWDAPGMCVCVIMAVTVVVSLLLLPSLGGYRHLFGDTSIIVSLLCCEPCRFVSE